MGSRGTPIDRFHRRLMWPIKEPGGDVVGFGARRIHDDDPVQAKYLNTAETLLFKKSTVLYGADLARRAIAQRYQAVIVEGYTDVMACHLAGVETAVASCGTAFGEEHVKLLRRLLHDQDAHRSEVIFTFDGDAAGQAAARKALAFDQHFVAQTFVAVEPGGRDPCELRQQEGDARRPGSGGQPGAAGRVRHPQRARGVRPRERRRSGVGAAGVRAAGRQDQGLGAARRVRPPAVGVDRHALARSGAGAGS